MKRALLVAASILLVGLQAGDLEDVYGAGLLAARESRWDDVISSMERAIELDPNPRASITIRRERHPYIPYFWIGKAWLARKDYGRAMEYFRRSETGVIARTAFYTDYRTSRSIAEAALAADAPAEVSSSREAATAAMQAALSAQTAALRAGATRTDEFGDASRLLREANEQLRLETADGYSRAEKSARDAEALFREAEAIAAGRTRRTRVSRPELQTPADTEPGPETETPVTDQPVEAPTGEPVAATLEETPEPEPAVETAPPAETATELPLDTDPTEAAPTPPTTSPTRPELESSAVLRASFHMLVRGDYSASARALSELIRSNTTDPEPYLMRGYARYMRSILEGNEQLGEEAVADLRQALSLDPTVRLDPKWFSPRAATLLDSLRDSR